MCDRHFYHHTSTTSCITVIIMIMMIMIIIMVRSFAMNLPTGDPTRRALLALLSPLLPGLLHPAAQRADRSQALSLAPSGAGAPPVPGRLLLPPLSRGAAAGGSAGKAVLASAAAGREGNKDPLDSAKGSSRSGYRAMASPVVRAAKLLVLSDPDDEANAALLRGEAAGGPPLPEGCSIVGVGTTFDELEASAAARGARMEDANAVFVSHLGARGPLARLLQECPRIEWIHTRSAGIDFLSSPALASFPGRVTNARGQFSSTLAEYAALAVSYFAKDLPRLLRNKQRREWDKYDVREVRGAALGILGYGDIGRASARLAAAHGMKIRAVRRKRGGAEGDEGGEGDGLADAIYGSSPAELRRLFSESDYVLCALPLTPETRGAIDRGCFDAAKPGCVFITVGRGPVVDEAEMVRALQDGRLRGAALDVFEVEPLPASSPLWELDNVLLSPHNMDKTATFMHESTEFFVREQLPRFVQGRELLNPVDPKAGY
jgi:phosphoglycerate dehydrogenase-like enzyme